jgi:16S rRNA G966 N2-methylase RsmD
VEKNQLYYGDNLEVLRQHIKDESVDLIYLDPPFNSRQDYNVLFAEKDGTRSSSQIMAFEDTWEWNVPTVASANPNLRKSEKGAANRPIRIRLTSSMPHRCDGWTDRNLYKEPENGSCSCRIFYEPPV